MKYEERIFVNKGIAIIRCPECKIISKIKVGGFEKKNHSLSLKCTCGNKFMVDLNFRQGIRKDTDFSGKYRNALEVDSAMKNCSVVNLSLRGIRLKTDNDHDIKIGDELEIEFVINGKQDVLFRRNIIVRNLNEQNLIGAEFLGTQQDNLNKHICIELMS